MKRFFFAFIFLCACVPESDTVTIQQSLQCWPGTLGTSSHVFSHTNASGNVETYQYRLYLPPTYTCGDDKSGFVAAFHGRGQTLNNFLNSDFMTEFRTQADDHNAVLLAIDAGPTNRWNHSIGMGLPSDDHAAMAHRLIRRLTRNPFYKLNIDRSQVHGIGYSNGGTFVQYLSNLYPTLFGAIGVIASISGEYATNCNPQIASCQWSYANIWGKSTPVSTTTDVDVMLVRGVLDPIFLEDGGWVRGNALTFRYTLPSYDSFDVSEYRLQKKSIRCGQESSNTSPLRVRRDCMGATDLRLDVVNNMTHRMPVQADTGYDGPGEVATFLFNHPN